MKRLIQVLLLWTILSSPAWGRADVTSFRHPSASFTDYRDHLRKSLNRRSPVDLIGLRLRNEELPSQLQNEIRSALEKSAQAPESSSEVFENLYRILEREPRTSAVLEAMIMVLERIQPTGAEAQASVMERMNVLKGARRSRSSLKPSLLHEEIQARLRVLRAKAGGEDLEVFVNGLPFSSGDDLRPSDRAQWLFVSSQWRPRMLEGTWGEISGRLDQPFENWVTGTCQDPVISDLSIGNGNSEAYFGPACEGAAALSGISPFPPAPVRPSFTKPLVWTAVAAGLTWIALSASGKKIRIQR